VSCFFDSRCSLNVSFSTLSICPVLRLFYTSADAVGCIMFSGCPYICAYGCNGTQAFSQRRDVAAIFFLLNPAGIVPAAVSYPSKDHISPDNVPETGPRVSPFDRDICRIVFPRDDQVAIYSDRQCHTASYNIVDC